MRLGMGLTLRQGIKCPACDGFISDHDPDCPQDKLTKFCQEAALREHSCPKCHGRVALNKGDFFECRKCHTQFSSGFACGEDADELERAFLFDVAMENATRVVVMTSKGDGVFRDDEIIASLREQVRDATERQKAKEE